MFRIIRAGAAITCLTVAVAAAEQAQRTTDVAEQKRTTDAAGPAAATAAAGYSLAQFAVCTNVEDRQPIGESASFRSDVGKLYCFTWVEAPSAPLQIFHRWYIGDRLVNEIPINVKGRRWRCWSAKTILSRWSGPCRVEIVTEEGEVLGTREFTLTASG